MKQYKMPLILGCLALILAVLSLIIGTIELIRHGVTTNTIFAAIIFIGGALSAFNLMRLHKQLKNRKPPGNKTEDQKTAAGATESFPSQENH